MAEFWELDLVLDTQVLFVPVAQSDMIFTALGEEFGLAGLFAIIGIYLLIIYRGFRIAIEASDEFNQLLAAGLTSIFAIQTSHYRRRKYEISTINWHSAAIPELRRQFDHSQLHYHRYPVAHLVQHSHGARRAGIDSCINVCLLVS